MSPQARVLSLLPPLLLLSSPLRAAADCAGGECAAGAEEDASLVQVRAQPQKAAAGLDYNYKGFQLGDWPDVAEMCGNGFNGGLQAPINIAVNGMDYEQMPKDSWPKFYAKDGGCPEAFFTEKKTAWQVDFQNPKENLACTNLEMEWNGKVYAMVQFHFHTLSEDTLDFEPVPLQMHMVHLAADGSFAVVGVMIRTEGWKKNGFLKGIFETGFETSRMVTAPKHGHFNPYAGVLTQFGEFWHYEGSFTTPPCTEGVDFLIAQDEVVTSASYVASYMEYLKKTGKGNSYGQNHRPIQPLNGRKISTGRFWEVCPKGPVPDCGKLDPEQVQFCEENA